MHVSNERFRVKYGRVQKSIWLLPLPVQITAEEGAAIVAIDDTIWIEHGYNSEDEVFPQNGSFIREEIFEETIKHMRCLRFARVYSTCDKNGFLIFMIPHILVQTISKALKLRTGLQKVIFIVLKEAPNLFLKSSF